MSESLRLEVVEEPPPVPLTPELRNGILAHPMVRTRWPGADLWFVSLDSYDKPGPEDEPWFRAILADMAGSDVIEAFGSLWDVDSVEVVPTGRARVPHEEEHHWAVETLRAGDPELAARIDAGELEVYRPFPPLASEQDAKGAVDRAIAVGVREAAGGRHRILGVRAVDGEVVAGAELAGPEAGVPDGPAPAAAAGSGAGAPLARVRVHQGDALLWDLVVVRPASSSGANGAGVELRDVEFQGVRVLPRAHAPIVTVAYDDGQAARVWTNEESAFEAEGDDPVPGYRVADAGAPPRTILERGEGGGSFRGVALWLDGDELVVVSQLEAGWHRYVSEWRLAADGTIRPRIGFAAVRNPRTAAPHTHHAYWRFDFDVYEPDQNQIQEHNDPPLPGQLARWHTIRYETGRRRDPSRQRRWRVKTVRAPHGYAIVPGPHDGTADAFGAGDLWVLVHHADEVDDGEGVTTDPARARPQLDRLVSGELVERQDIVVWYGVHVDGAAPAKAGPDLTAFNWRAKVERAPYEVLSPPVAPAPDDEDEDDEDDEDEDA